MNEDELDSDRRLQVVRSAIESVIRSLPDSNQPRWSQVSSRVVEDLSRFPLPWDDANIGPMDDHNLLASLDAVMLMVRLHMHKICNMQDFWPVLYIVYRSLIQECAICVQESSYISLIFERELLSHSDLARAET